MFKRYAPALVALAFACGAQSGVVGEKELGVGSTDGQDDEESSGTSSNRAPNSTPAADAAAAEEAQTDSIEGDDAVFGSDAGTAPVYADEAADEAAGNTDAQSEITTEQPEIEPGLVVSGADGGSEMSGTATGQAPSATSPANGENPTPEPCTDPTVISLPPEEIAKRLSELIFNAPASEELLQRAVDGELGTYGQVGCAAAEMIEQPEAANGLLAFLDTWLGFDAWPHEPDPALDPAVWTEMQLQASTYLADFATSGTTTLDQLLTEQESFVGPLLAEHLGLEETSELPAVITVPQQRGLLTLGLVTASLNRIGPRGTWLVQTLQCMKIPAKPPSVMPTAFADGPGFQEDYRASVSEAVCAGCHSVIDPYGFGLENFDSVGRFRTEEGGTPLSVSGEIYNDEESGSRLTYETFEGLDDFTETLAASGLVARCLADTMLYHAAGVEVALADPELAGELRNKLRQPFEASGGDLSSLLVSVTQVDNFWQ